jgi:hypothetical protein
MVTVNDSACISLTSIQIFMIHRCFQSYAASCSSAHPHSGQLCCGLCVIMHGDPFATIRSMRGTQVWLECSAADSEHFCHTSPNKTQSILSSSWAAAYAVLL